MLFQAVVERKSRKKTEYDPHHVSILNIISFIALFKHAVLYFIPFKAYKQFTCLKHRYSFRSIKQFGNVTKFILGQPLGHVKGAPRKEWGHDVDHFKNSFLDRTISFTVWK